MNYYIVPGDLIVQILVIKTADSLPIHLEKSGQWFWTTKTVRERCMFLKLEEEDL